MKSINVQKGEPIPYGVTVYNDRINFSMALGNCMRCQIKFYHKNTDKCIGFVSLDETYKRGNVFAVAILRKNLELLLKKDNLSIAHLSYTYEADEKELIDPYSVLLFGREQYGSVEKQSKLRGGFSLEEFNWEGDKPLEIPLSQSIIYKIHVRGFTKHSSSNVQNKGTFLGVTEKISYLLELGINCIQLMPAYEYNEILQLSNLGLTDKTNYWGYSEDNYYFAPKASYAANPDKVDIEFKTMIRSLHQKGVEVIMEMNFSRGTNYILALEALRHWVLEYHVDGFVIYAEYELAQMIAQDRILDKVKLMHHNWNESLQKTDEGYKHLADYNWDYATNIRRLNRGDEEQVRQFGSNFIKNYEKKGVVNYITNHDGFTLADLYSYDVKHNEKNGEKNIDGFDYNYSFNCGKEGITENKKIIRLREQLIRNAFVILLLSQGTPLILGGDEFFHSQEGNNNAYCQDNEMTWLNWENLEEYNQVYQFVKQLVQMRKEHPVFHRELPLRGMDYIYCGMPDVSFHSTKAWYADYNHYSRVLGILFSGKYAKVNNNTDDGTFYLAINMHGEKKGFYLPNAEKGQVWSEFINTFTGVIHTEFINKDILVNQRYYDVPARSIVILISKKMEEI